jgi:tRNA threonylcarbamoyladenosine biosynthesis protein TsaE
MPILDLYSLEFISRSTEQTRRVGMRIGALLQTGDLIGLIGDLGSGKTTLVQGIAAGWGSPDPVTSPTFVLVNLYRRLDRKQMFHVDAYRLNSAQEAIDLDLDAMLEQGIVVIEWAERIQSVLPIEGLWVSLRWIDDQQRDFIFKARGAHYEALLTRLRRQVYGG